LSGVDVFAQHESKGSSILIKHMQKKKGYGIAKILQEKKKNPVKNQCVRKQKKKGVKVCSRPPVIFCQAAEGEKKNNHEITRQGEIPHKPILRLPFSMSCPSPSSHLIPSNPFFFQPNFMRGNRPNEHEKSKNSHPTNQSTETMHTHKHTYTHTPLAQLT